MFDIEIIIWKVVWHSHCLLTILVYMCDNSVDVLAIYIAIIEARIGCYVLKKMNVLMDVYGEKLFVELSKW